MERETLAECLRLAGMDGMSDDAFGSVVIDEIFAMRKPSRACAEGRASDPEAGVRR